MSASRTEFETPGRVAPEADKVEPRLDNLPTSGRARFLAKQDPEAVPGLGWNQDLMGRVLKCRTIAGPSTGFSGDLPGPLPIRGVTLYGTGERKNSNEL